MCGVVCFIGVILMIARINAEFSGHNVEIDTYSGGNEYRDAIDSRTSDLFITTLNSILGKRDRGSKDSIIFARTTPNTLSVWKVLNASLLSTTPNYRDAIEEVFTSTPKAFFVDLNKQGFPDNNINPRFRNNNNNLPPIYINPQLPNNNNYQSLNNHNFPIPSNNNYVPSNSNYVPSKQNLLRASQPLPQPVNKVIEQPAVQPVNKTSKNKKRKSKGSNVSQKKVIQKNHAQKFKGETNQKPAQNDQRAKTKHLNKNVQTINSKVPIKRAKASKNATVSRKNPLSTKDRLLRAKLRQAQAQAQKRSKTKRSKPFPKLKNKTQPKIQAKHKQDMKSKKGPRHPIQRKTNKRNIKPSKQPQDNMYDTKKKQLKAWRPGDKLSVNNLVKKVFFDE